jgi:hypothetical protein
MAAKDAKQFVYRYNGDAKSEEVEPDMLGEASVPEKDNIVFRQGKNWKVVHLITEIGSDDRLPVIRVFLTDQII